jgi:hypothetical protein
MISLRCYLIGPDDKIQSFANLTAETRDEAVDEARAMLGKSPCCAFELWNGRELVYFETRAPTDVGKPSPEHRAVPDFARPPAASHTATPPGALRSLSRPAR